MWQDPEYRKAATERNRQNALAQWTDSFRRKRSIEQSSYMKIHPEQWVAMASAAFSPDIRKKTLQAVSKTTSRRNKERWQDPIYRERKSKMHSTTMREWWASHPEARNEKSRLMGETARRLWSDPVHRSRISLMNGDRAKKWFRYSYLRKNGLVVNVKSKAELAYSEYLDGEGVTWSYEPTWLCLSDGSRYLPDFHVVECGYYIEVKGWPWNDDKYQKAVADGFPVKLLSYKEAIQCRKSQL